MEPSDADPWKVVNFVLMACKSNESSFEEVWKEIFLNFNEYWL